MPRSARVVIPGIGHHVTQRGNRRAQVFFGQRDYRMFLGLLERYAGEHELGVVAYCLMPNHVHLVAVPSKPESLAAALKPVHLRYAQHVNWTQDVSGRLWQGRFYSAPLDERHFWAAVRYAERNPVRAGLVEDAWDYRWSSAAAHCGMRHEPLLSGDLERADHVGDWSAWLSDGDDEEAMRSLRRNTRTGRPCGGEGFVARLEALTGRRLTARAVGRPKREPKK